MFYVLQLRRATILKLNSYEARWRYVQAYFKTFRRKHLYILTHYKRASCNHIVPVSFRTESVYVRNLRVIPVTGPRRVFDCH